GRPVAVPVLLVGVIDADDGAQPGVGVVPLAGGGRVAPRIAVRDTGGVHFGIEDGVAEAVREGGRNLGVPLYPVRVPGGLAVDAVPEGVVVGPVGRRGAVLLDPPSRRIGLAVAADRGVRGADIGLDDRVVSKRLRTDGTAVVQLRTQGLVDVVLLDEGQQ